MSDAQIPSSERTNLIAALRAALASGDDEQVAAARHAMDEDDATWASVAFGRREP